MGRAFFINGPTLVQYQGNELGLSDNPISITPTFKHLEIQVNAWGQVPPEVQWMLSEATLNFTLVHFDPVVLQSALGNAAGGVPAGQMAGAGFLLGKGGCLAPLRFTSPIGNQPWTFLNTYLMGTPVSYPLGTERSIVNVTFKAIPYAADPYNGGQGAQGQALWTYT